MVAVVSIHVCRSWGGLCSGRTAVPTVQLHIPLGAIWCIPRGRKKKKISSEVSSWARDEKPTSGGADLAISQHGNKSVQKQKTISALSPSLSFLFSQVMHDLICVYVFPASLLAPSPSLCIELNAHAYSIRPLWIYPPHPLFSCMVS